MNKNSAPKVAAPEQVEVNEASPVRELLNSLKVLDRSQRHMECRSDMLTKLMYELHAYREKSVPKIEVEETPTEPTRTMACIHGAHPDHCKFCSPLTRKQVELPPRPQREHMKQFATALVSYDYVQYAEFKRYADALEAENLRLRSELSERGEK